MSTSYGSRWPKYGQQWDAMERTRLTAERAVAAKLFSNKSHYVAVQEKTGVPWYMIACIHQRESDASFSTQLAQGDPLNQVSTHVPKGMGPYHGVDAWERAAIEALELDGLTEVIDWRLEKILYYFEKFNGWGYANKGVPSPYVWAGSNQYESGKYIADGMYSPSAVDQQIGCAPILRSLMELDDSIKIQRETPKGVEPAPQESTVPETPAIIPPLPRVDANVFVDLFKQLGPIIGEQIKAELQKPENQQVIKGTISAALPQLLGALGISVPGIGIVMMVAGYVLPLIMPDVMGANAGAATLVSGLGVTGIPVISKILGVLDRFKA